MLVSLNCFLVLGVRELLNFKVSELQGICWLLDQCNSLSLSVARIRKLASTLTIMWVFGLCLFLHFQFHVLPFFSSFLFWHMNSNLTWVYCSCTVYHCSRTVHTLKNIKNGSHDTIHVFKNYFATVPSVFSFSNNKPNPNGPYMYMKFWKESEWVLASALTNICIWSSEKSQSGS